jgi:hypothetical protein
MGHSQMTTTTAKWIVDGVKVEHLLYVWDDAWPYLLAAVKRFPNVSRPYTEASVLKDLYDKKLQLWVGWDVDKNKVSGAVVTEILADEKHEGKLFLSIPLVGAEHWNEWGDALWMVLKQWGRHNGCTHALGYGRKGWKRLYGFVDCGKTPGGVPMYVRTLKG